MKAMIVILAVLSLPAYAARQSLNAPNLQAEIEFTETDIYLYFPTEITQRVWDTRAWDTLAFVSTQTPEGLPYRRAHLLVLEGDHYVIKTAAPQRILWTLELVLLPKKGQGRGIEATWTFLDRALVKELP